ncbi:helix-turn-helix domain-containing protein [Pseudomonas sp. TWR2-1-1]
MRMPADVDYITAKETASILGVSVDTLRFWRYTGKHTKALTPYANISRRVFYKRDDVQRFFDSSMTAIA